MNYSRSNHFKTYYLKHHYPEITDSRIIDWMSDTITKYHDHYDKSVLDQLRYLFPFELVVVEFHQRGLLEEVELRKIPLGLKCAIAAHQPHYKKILQQVPPPPPEIPEFVLFDLEKM